MYCNKGLIKVYLLNGALVVDPGNGTAKREAPSSWGYTYYDAPDNRSRDRININSYGQAYISDKAPDQIARQDGTLVSPTVNLQEVIDYFVSLGMGIDSGAGNGPTMEQFNALVERVEALEQAAGFIKLDTPAPVATGLTASTANISWPSVLHADSYDVYLDDELIDNTTQLNYSITGLTADTGYAVEVVAKGSGNYIDSDAGMVNFSTPASGGGTNQNIFPLTFPFQFSA